MLMLDHEGGQDILESAFNLIWDDERDHIGSVDDVCGFNDFLFELLACPVA